MKIEVKLRLRAKQIEIRLMLKTYRLSVFILAVQMEKRIQAPSKTKLLLIEAEKS